MSKILKNKGVDHELAQKDETIREIRQKKQCCNQVNRFTFIPK
jgi:hypothetical protein